MYSGAAGRVVDRAGPHPAPRHLLQRRHLPRRDRRRVEETGAILLLLVLILLLL